MPRSTPDPTLVTAEVLRGWRLPEPNGDKNTRGSILVIGGSAETAGAVLLAAESAMRAGAGKLQVATAASVARLAAVALPEALVRALPETGGGAIRADAADSVRDLVEAADAVLMGPGMTDTEQTREFIACTISAAGRCSPRTRWNSRTRCTSTRTGSTRSRPTPRWTSPAGPRPSSGWAG